MQNVRQLVSLTDNEIQIIKEALKFQMVNFFEKEEILDVERLYSLKLGEISDRLDKYLK